MTVKDVTLAMSGAVDALKHSPLLLALVLLQFMLVIVLAWTAHDVRVNERGRFELLLKQCGPREQTSRGFDGPRLQSDESRPFTLPPLPELPKPTPDPP
jgi:hypothetical protein